VDRVDEQQGPCGSRSGGTDTPHCEGTELQAQQGRRPAGPVTEALEDRRADPVRGNTVYAGSSSETEATRTGMRAEGAELVIYANQGSDVEEQMRVLKEMEQEKVDGIAITPIEDEKICERLSVLSKTIPIVTINRDMPSCNRICYVGQDNYRSGRAGAGLMNILLNGRGKVLTVIGPAVNQSHENRYEGFADEMKHFRDITVLPAEQCFDNPQIAYRSVYRLLSERSDINGIYFAGNGQDGACRAVKELGLKGKVHIVCHDLTEENVQNLKDGCIDFLIDQNVHEQATRPLKVLLDYVMTGSRPKTDRILTDIGYRNQYNI
jgi:LacI family transcriptional regulator